MATGLTSGVQRGEITDFRTFALICARQFGATIMERDAPANEPPKLRVEDTYHKERIKESKARIKWLNSLSLDQAQAELDRERVETEEYNTKSLQETADYLERYEDMLEAVHAWTPPTPDHQNLKDLMIKQLTSSIAWDCKPYFRDVLSSSYTPSLWLEHELSKVNKDLEYNIREAKKEHDRVVESNNWITALYDSLKEYIV